MIQSCCANCGKAAPKQTDQVELLNDEQYQGNLQVIRRRVYQMDGTSSRVNIETGEATVLDKIVQLTLWDGESYEPQRYGVFCTLRCAQAFANGAYQAGYRRV